MSRRKGATVCPKRLNEVEQNRTTWHLSLARRTEDGENISNDLIDDSESQQESSSVVASDDQVPTKIARLSEEDCNRIRYYEDINGDRIYTNFDRGSNCFKLENARSVSDDSDVVSLGTFSIRFKLEMLNLQLEEMLNSLEILYLHRTENVKFVCEHESEYILFFDDPGKWSTVTHGKGIVCNADLNEEEFRVLRDKFSSLSCVRFQISHREKDTLECRVYVKEKIFSSNPYIPPISARLNLNMRILLKRFCNFESFSYGYLSSARQNIEQFFEQLKIYRNLHIMSDVNRLSTYRHHPDFVPFLRPYQKDAVRWMMWREKGHFESERAEVEKNLNPLFVEYCLNDRPIFYNPYTWVIMRERPAAPPGGVPGGILADEMGLGKTVEILALILLNPKISQKNAIDSSIQRNSLSTKCETSSDVVKDLVDELVSLVACKIETDLAFGQKTLERKTRRSKQALEEKKRKKNPNDFTNSAKKRVFETAPKLSCFCGKHDFEVDNSRRIQCQSCGTLQHEECVNWIWNTSDDYLCPHCRTAAAPIDSKTTLIISPQSICHQWYQEILKHIRSYALKVYIYEGVNADGFVQPKFLAENDIVITTYETLRSELNYLDLPHSNRFRNPKRFLSAPTPLTAVRWWRVCLDEAQMVEGLSKAASMCLRLPCVNRWCVTGTPVQKSVADLHGLLIFLDVEPYGIKDVWNSALFYPFLNGHPEMIVNAVAPLLWRTLKENVLDQLGIPEQEQRLYWLEFSPIEEHFYRRTHEECSRAITGVLRQLTDKDKRLKSLDRVYLDKIFRPLLKLRQACCHPQIVRGRFVTIHKNQMTMEEVLKSMIKKTKTECEDEHRAIVAALNGLAGLKQLRNEWPEAADIYREVLRICTSTENEKKIRTDPLPQIHALHNLHELLTLHNDVIAPACRDDTLSVECDQVKNKYLTKSLNSVHECNTQMNEFYSITEEYVKKLQKTKDDAWFIEICVRFRSSADFEWDLLNQISNALSNSKTSVGCVSLMDKFRNLNGLQMVLLNLYEKLMESRTNLCTSVVNLAKMDTFDESVVTKASACHLRPGKNSPIDTCPICVVDCFFDNYEEKLFNFKPDDNPNDTVAATTSIIQNEADGEDIVIYGKLRKGTWADSPLEVTLKAIYQFLSRHERNRTFTDLTDLIQPANDHLKLFDMMKKEFRGLRASWMAIRDHVALRDELSIATEKFRFRTPEDVAPTNNSSNAAALNLHIIEPHQIAYMETKLNLDRVTAENQFQQKLGQLSYLSNLEMMPPDADGQGNPEECPICRNPLGCRWSLLTCGHTFCCDCIRVLTNGQLIKCPVCRQPTNRNNVTFVTTQKPPLQADNEQGGVDVKGSHSTKVESIVKCLKNIQRHSTSLDPVKCLIFSSWTEILIIIAQALVENDLNYVMLTGNTGVSTQKKLTVFKESQDCNILLLPIHCGAKGLNIVEASHIILVEPLLNPAEEQQALGRVHRMGQKKRTVVHKFLIRGTIEEKLHTMLGDTKTDHLINDSESPLTVGDLDNLFQI